MKSKNMGEYKAGFFGNVATFFVRYKEFKIK